MQGLKESGTFSSLIESAQRSTLEVEQLLSVKNNSTNTKAIDVSNILSKNRDKIKESAMTGRKVLEVSDFDLLAVPPLPPPTINDI